MKGEEPRQLILSDLITEDILAGIDLQGKRVLVTGFWLESVWRRHGLRPHVAHG
jgi:hypothetical protein